MIRKEVLLNNSDRFCGEYKIPKEKVNDAINRALKKLESKIDIYADGFPGTWTEDIVYNIENENKNWVSGMHTGCFLLSYELSGDEKFLEVAKKTYANI